MANGIVYGGTDVSSSSTFCSPVLDTHCFSAGTNQSEGILGYHPNVICQICHAPDHSTDTCRKRYHHHQQPVLPAYAISNFVDAGVQIWYPDSAAASTMTPDDGKLLTKTVYSRPSLVKIGNGTYCLSNMLVIAFLLLLLSHCALAVSFMLPSCVITSYLFGNCVVTTTVV